MLHFSEKDVEAFSEECSKLIETPITCVMIINISIPSHFDTSQIITKLELLKLSCTNFANHYSIVLVKSIETNKYYWIRGIRWNHKDVFQFGAEYPKTELDKTIKYA